MLHATTGVVLIISTRFRVQESKTPLGVMPAESEIKPAELVRAFKRANQKVWTIKDDQVPPAPVALARDIQR